MLSVIQMIPTDQRHVKQGFFIHSLYLQESLSKASMARKMIMGKKKISFPSNYVSFFRVFSDHFFGNTG